MKEKTSLGGSFTFAGTSLTVNRVGYGAMQLAGQDGDKMVWGPPRDVPGAIAVLREAVASGVIPCAIHLSTGIPERRSLLNLSSRAPAPAAPGRSNGQ